MSDLTRRSALSLALAATAAATTVSGEAEAAADETTGQAPRMRERAGPPRASFDPASIESLKIYPPLGLARVGNAEGVSDYIIGPEAVGGPATLPDGSPARYLADFRAAEGHIKRQAARFRVYAHLKDGSVREITAADARITWRVAVANLKAGWYEFNEAMDLPRGLTKDALQRNRDLSVSGGRASLDITPAPRSIEGRNAKAVAFDDGTFWHKRVYLGELRTDGEGRLLFFSGFGRSAPFREGTRPLTYANNIGWHDDISDGPVRATVTFADGASREAEAGYVAVTPPNYAPGMIGLVTMDDAVRETFQQQKWIAPPTATSFTNDIWPLFDRLTSLQWVNHGSFVVHGHGSPLDARSAATIDRLRDASAGNAPWRRAVFALFRDPKAGGRADELKLPQVYGDGLDDAADALAFLAVTPTQYAHLRRWADGAFASDWPGAPPEPPAFDNLTPRQQVAHLERAALHDCLGGPFHPGIELTWVMRLPRVWKGAYRLNVLASDKPARQDFGEKLTPAECVGRGGPYDGVAAGALTRFMGVPWQTDQASCNSATEYSPSSFLSMPTFWGARAPDQVLAAANFERAAKLDAATSSVQAQKHFMLRVEWLRDVRDVDYYGRIANMVQDWWALGSVLPVADPPAHLPPGTRFEQGRSPKAAGSDPKRHLVAAVEALAAPVSVAEVNMLRAQAPAGPPIPPQRTFRPGEI